MLIRLTMAECILANIVGCARQDQAAGRPDARGFRGDGYRIHAFGAAGELAAARALGVPWVPTCNAGKVPDIAPDWQVRARARADYDLIVRPDDAQYERFILVLGHSYPVWDVAGWCYGHEAMHPEWWREHGGRPGAWFMPRSALRVL
jgi:hypothetical protein